MKKNYFHLSMIIIILIIMTLAGCQSTSTTNQTAVSPQPIQRIDYQGAAIGSPIPEWVEYAVNRDVESIKRIPRFNGKVPIVAEGNGQNLDLLRSWVNNFNVSAEVSRRITNYVEAEFGGKLVGSKDTPESRNVLNEVVTSISNTRFSGLAREMDYWIKVRMADGKEEFRYYVIFSIDEENLQHQIDVAMGRVSARTAEQRELLNDVQDAMRRTRWNSMEYSN